MSATVPTPESQGEDIAGLGPPSLGNPAVRWALAYAALGWPVLQVWHIEGGRCACSAGAACRSPGKHPVRSGWQTDATTDEVEIRRMWMRNPRAHVAVHVGRAGLLVVDIDPRNGGDATIRELEREHGPLTSAAVAETGGGGEHRVFLAPEAGTHVPGKLGPGVDLKRGEGYIVVAPSGHVSGRDYAWRRDRDPFGNAFLMIPPPEWVFRGGGGRGAKKAAAAPDEERSAAPPPPMPEPPDETAENVSRLRGALGFVSARCDRDAWRDVLFSVHSTGWACAAEIARDWSRTAPELWDAEAFEAIWSGATADHPGGRTVASVFRAARLNGWQDPGAEPPETFGDVSNGRRFAARHRGRFLYVVATKAWLAFDGSRWRRCQAGEEVQAAKAVADELVAEAALAFMRSPTEASKRNHGQAVAVHRSASRVRDMVALAASEPGVSVPDPASLDADPLLLGVQNGVVDLRTGTLVPAHPGQRISKQAGARFDPGAACPLWERFLEEVLGDAEVIAFVQRALGYTLTGLTDEEKLFFLFGIGANGKSVFANVVCGVLGEYAVTVGSELLARNKHENEAARYKNRLPGARLALANEVGEGDTWDDHRMKELVSRERIAARALYGEAFDFVPAHKIWVRGNHKPAILDAGDGMWRRIVLIGFERRITEGERVPDLDRQLVDAERDGILGWMVRGCLDWRRCGLEVPRAIADATSEYREDSDVLGSWIAERCEAAPGERMPTDRAYADYQLYIKDLGMTSASRPAFVRRMGTRGYKQKPSNSVPFLHGLKLRVRHARAEDFGGGGGGVNATGHEGHERVGFSTNPL